MFQTQQILNQCFKQQLFSSIDNAVYHSNVIQTTPIANSHEIEHESGPTIKYSFLQAFQESMDCVPLS